MSARKALRLVTPASDPGSALATQPEPPRRDLATRWGGNEGLFAKGWVPVPLLFLELASTLKPFSLTPSEMLFVINLMAHKWDERAPYPGYKRLAALTGVTEGYARKMARSLERKRLLHRSARIGSTNEFHLSPLFAAMADAMKVKAAL